jgi:hypothetical protein
MTGKTTRERAPGEGAATRKLPYIERAAQNGGIFVEQPHELCSAEKHDVWQRLYARIQGRWPGGANQGSWKGLPSLLRGHARAAGRQPEPLQGAT